MEAPRILATIVALVSVDGSEPELSDIEHQKESLMMPCGSTSLSVIIWRQGSARSLAGSDVGLLYFQGIFLVIMAHSIDGSAHPRRRDF